MICKLKEVGGKGRVGRRKSTRQPRISDTSHLERKFQCLGRKFGARSELRAEVHCAQAAQSPAHCGRLARPQLVRGASWSFPRDLSLDLAETIDKAVGNMGDLSKNRVKRPKELRSELPTQECSFFFIKMDKGQRDNE